MAASPCWALSGKGGCTIRSECSRRRSAAESLETKLAASAVCSSIGRSAIPWYCGNSRSAHATAIRLMAATNEARNEFRWCIVLVCEGNHAMPLLW
jgi:hypothetical protein